MKIGNEQMCQENDTSDGYDMFKNALHNSKIAIAILIYPKSKRMGYGIFFNKIAHY